MEVKVWMPEKASEGEGRDLTPREFLELGAFLSKVLVGPCPRCGSLNTHDLGKDPDYAGPYCPLTERYDDPTIGHCDDCGYLWCLECGEEITEEDETPCGMLLCEHHLICSDCGADPCPYEGHIFDCPKIVEWKERKKTVRGRD